MRDDDVDDDVSTGGRAGDGTVEVLLVVVPDPELDAEAAERPVRRLRSEIAALDVDAVRPVPAGPVPDGAKGADPVTVGAVVVALSASGGVFTALIDTVRDWLARSAARHRVSLTIDGDTIELEHASGTERRDLIDAYIRRHSGG
ncbi:effector-associated constant component EACC1 [Streptomyces fumanus]|uniref:Uncharacterized protein n=1 Tax=Streptomyces fumanus TaxID=67302 RepID=A0A919A8P8_9ACTN|nr:hypothetical protein [Streptomyces fumanus]GHE93442.1 hypothetical protein GCM10018772_16530 [Streptomyces fumanus]